MTGIFFKVDFRRHSADYRIYQKHKEKISLSHMRTSIIDLKVTIPV